VNPLSEKPQIDYLQVSSQVLETFRINWKPFLGIHITVNILSLVVLTPLITLIMGWLILASGHKALTDEDILFFILSPTGLTVTLLAGALYTTLAIFLQAAMITAGRVVTRGHTISLIEIGRFLLVKLRPLFQLALHMIGRTALIAAPFLAISALIYYLTLTEFDINYYLSDRPAVFWWAGGLISLCLLTMAGILLRIFSGWALALPLLLIDNESPARSLSKSRSASVSLRIPIALILLLLFLLNAGMLGLASLLTDFAVDFAVALAGESLQVLAYLLGSLVIVWLVTNVAIAFFINSTLALVILSLFNRLINTSDNGFFDQRLLPEQTSRRRQIPLAQLAGLALIISLATGVAIRLTMDRLNVPDNTMVIAHRGASADAPENTLSALELAINDGADWVEIDVQETRQGEVVVIHDSDLKKIGGSGLKVFEASLAELQSVDIGSWMDSSFSDQRVPTLQQVLALCKDRINIVIELKYYGEERQLEERVADIVDAAGMQDQIVVMSLSYPGIQKMKSIRPGWMVGLLSSVAIGDITRLNADFFAVNATFAKRSFIRRAHNRNRKVLVWTVNDPVSMSAMMSKGVDGIITDKPALASKIRTERAELDIHERMMIQLASFIGRQPTRPEQ
jgi:glycerophosphoryl diester phosphodiesterase